VFPSFCPSVAASNTNVGFGSLQAPEQTPSPIIVASAKVRGLDLGFVVVAVGMSVTLNSGTSSVN
jgi:hypothetical protein